MGRNARYVYESMCVCVFRREEIHFPFLTYQIISPALEHINNKSHFVLIVAFRFAGIGI